MGKITPTGAFAATPAVEVYSHDHATGAETLVQRTGGPPSSDEVARQAFTTATNVRDYYRTTFGRDGFDGAGATTKVIVHSEWDGSHPMGNAYWVERKGTIELGDGDGVRFAPLGAAPDVVAHEFAHGIVDRHVKLGGGQGGGLNESWSDVLASGIDGNWKIGETAYTPSVPGDALRDLEHPHAYDHVSKLPPGETEPHAMSEIPSYAAVRVAQKIGADRMRQVWYTGLSGGYLKSNSGYSGAARATMEAAAKLYGRDGAEFAAVRDAWKAVGVDPRWTAKRRSVLEGASQAFAGGALLSAANQRVVQRP